LLVGFVSGAEVANSEASARSQRPRRTGRGTENDRIGMKLVRIHTKYLRVAAANDLDLLIANAKFIEAS
jgi:hypothetical protein